MEKYILIKWAKIIDIVKNSYTSYDWNILQTITIYKEKELYIIFIYRRKYPRKITIIISNEKNSNKSYTCNKSNTYDLKRHYNNDENIEDSTFSMDLNDYMKVDYETGEKQIDYDTRKIIINQMLYNFKPKYNIISIELTNKIDLIFESNKNNLDIISKLLIITSTYGSELFIEIYKQYALLKSYYINLTDCVSIWSLNIDTKMVCLYQLTFGLSLEKIFSDILKGICINPYYSSVESYINDYINKM